MKDEVVIVVVVTAEPADSRESGIRSRSSTRSYSEGWERIFGKAQERTPSRPQDMN